MIVIPAVDILDGKCVRLYQGDYEKETVYFEDPVKMACLLRILNSKVIHIVDLNAARAETGSEDNNRDSISKICQALDIPVQVGGGIRTMEDIRQILNAGAYRVIIGTAAVTNPELVSEAIAEFGKSRIVVGIDALDGIPRVRGWTEGSGATAVELALDMEARGCCRIVYTDISRDGTMAGPNIEAYRELAESLTKTKITASGGVSGYEDLVDLKQLPSSVDSVIVGKALYENSFPCQSFWCWHEKDKVDLDTFSSAKLKSGEC